MNDKVRDRQYPDRRPDHRARNLEVAMAKKYVNYRVGGTPEKKDENIK